MNTKQGISPTNTKNNLWDKKSNKYPRYSPEISLFNEAVLINLRDFGVEFSNKSIVDIGCGTGVWTLYLAQMCKQISGVDSSDGMLEILREDAKAYDIKNLQIIHSSWADFTPQNRYNIAISTMSPAIKFTDDFIKFHNMADTKIYLNFLKPRASSILKPFFEKFDVKSSMGSGVANLNTWLNDNQISFKRVTLSESRVAKRTKDEAFKNICWNLDINDVKYDKNDVLLMLEELYTDEIIEEKLDSLMSLFVF